MLPNDLQIREKYRRKWFCSVEGTIYGPFSTPELKELRYELPATTLVKLGKEGSWHKISDLKVRKPTIAAKLPTTKVSATIQSTG